MFVIIDRRNAEEWPVIGPFASDDEAVCYGAEHLGGICAEWGIYSLEAPVAP